MPVEAPVETAPAVEAPAVEAAPPQQEQPATTTPAAVTNPLYSGQTLNSVNGRIEGPSGQETYYNLDMSEVVRQSQPGGWIYNEAAAHGHAGNLSSNVWVRDDGAKMMGNYVMIAADLSVHPRGSLVPTSLGMGIVVDTGDFAATNPTQVDIATTW